VKASYFIYIAPENSIFEKRKQAEEDEICRTSFG
jgi:hypothetical protein